MNSLRLFASAALLSTLFIGLGCASDPSLEPPKPAPASSLEPSPTPPPDAAPAFDAAPLPCHAEPNTAPAVEITQVAESRPAFVGGTIVDGTYHRTAALVYTGPGGASGPTGKVLHQTLIIKGSIVDTSYRDDDGEDDARIFSITPSGTTVRFVQTCPDPSDGLTDFTASPTELRIGAHESGELNVYTRVP